jgi:hypothetical protein
MHHVALEACVLIALYRCAGQWISSEQIAARLGVTGARVLAVCGDLSARARVRHSVVMGQDMYASCVGGVRT